MGRKVKNWKNTNVDDELVAPHRMLWSGSIAPNGRRIDGDISMATSLAEAKLCFSYEEGDVVCLEDGEGFVKALVMCPMYFDRDHAGFRRECYKVQRATAKGKWSKVWEYAYPGYIQRGYRNAGLAPDYDGALAA